MNLWLQGASCHLISPKVCILTLDWIKASEKHSQKSLLFSSMMMKMSRNFIMAFQKYNFGSKNLYQKQRCSKRRDSKRKWGLFISIYHFCTNNALLVLTLSQLYVNLRMSKYLNISQCKLWWIIIGQGQRFIYFWWLSFHTAFYLCVIPIGRLF